MNRPQPCSIRDRKRATWLAQRRGKIALGSLIGVVGVGGAFAAPGGGDSAAAGEKAGPLMQKQGQPNEAVERDGAIHTAGWDLPHLEHDRVDFWVERFAFNADMRKKMEGFLSGSGRYGPMILEKLEERDMPRDLIYLAMIESGFDPQAYSPADASGLWQFIASTGQRFGLDIDRAVDERNDPVRATDAALDYLTYLHDRFGSWYLAAAAYNTGEGRVGRIMRETFGREQAGSEGDYYRIWSKLPRETRDYVPLMMAAGRIAKDPHRYGFGDIELAPPLEYEEVEVPPATQLYDVAHAAGVSLMALKELNPHFRLERTPNNRDYPVRLPKGTLAEFGQNWSLELDPEVKVAVGD